MTPSLPSSHWDEPKAIDPQDELFPSRQVGQRLAPPFDEFLHEWMQHPANAPWIEFARAWEKGFKSITWVVRDGLDVHEVKRHLETVARSRLMQPHKRIAVAALAQRWMPEVPEYVASPISIARTLPRQERRAAARRGRRS